MRRGLGGRPACRSLGLGRANLEEGNKHQNGFSFRLGIRGGKESKMINGLSTEALA